MTSLKKAVIGSEHKCRFSTFKKKSDAIMMLRSHKTSTFAYRQKKTRLLMSRLIECPRCLLFFLNDTGVRKTAWVVRRPRNESSVIVCAQRTTSRLLTTYNLHTTYIRTRESELCFLVIYNVMERRRHLSFSATYFVISSC